MNGVLRISGPLAVACPVCEVAPGSGCITAPHCLVRRPLRKPHGARVKAAPPEQTVRPGDLVIVRFGFNEVTALFLGAPFLARVRLWDARLGQWGREVDRMLGDVLRLAPEDETTAAARVALAGQRA